MIHTNKEQQRKEEIKRIIQKLMIIIPMIIASYAVIRADITLHEKVHELIFEDYGINSTTETKGLLSGTTIGAIPKNMSMEDYRMMNFAHEMNEVESYNNSSTKLLLIIIIFLMVCNAIRD